MRTGRAVHLAHGFVFVFLFFPPFFFDFRCLPFLLQVVKRAAVPLLDVLVVFTTNKSRSLFLSAAVYGIAFCLP